MAFNDVTRFVQRRLGLALRSRVAGDDAPVHAERIWGAEGERWFTPDDPIWKVHSDASMFSGGIASLLLQSLHPMAMAGVAGHSGYKGDPWGRLQRTSHYLAITTYGTVEHAHEVIGHVRSIHERVRGKDEMGRPYFASDPHLLRWVHLAEIDSFLRAYQTFGAESLSPRDTDRYVEQAGIPAALLGVIDPPSSTDPSSRRPPPPGMPPASCCSTRPCPTWCAPATAPSHRVGCPSLRRGPSRCSTSRCPGP